MKSLQQIKRSLWLGVVLLLALPAGASAHLGHQVSHVERVQAGPYEVQIEFSEWPIKAERSLDIVFWVEGGIEGKRGTLRQIYGELQSGSPAPRRPLVRHPRYRTAWGLDQTIMQREGVWRFEFEIDGPRGKGVGQSPPLPVAPRPGPPAPLSYLIGLLPLLGMAGFLTMEARRVRRLRPTDATQW